MAIGVLGPLSCDVDATFGRRDRAVLTALAMCVGRAVTADQLADAVWGAAPPATAHKALQGCMVRLRRALGPTAIETSATGYRLALSADEVDARLFERMLGRSRELLALGEPERAAYTLTQALGLWRGAAFEDVEDWDLAVIEAGRLDELRLEAEELRVEAHLRTGRHLDVLASAESMARAAPMRERRWALLALAQYQSGRQTEALRTIQGVKTLLAERLGLDSGPELATLEEMILRQDGSLLAGCAVVTSDICPYRGLTAYDVDDAEVFFGRDDDVRACLDLLRLQGSLAVVGPSGSGKSSLVRAGIAAALRRDGHEVTIITPGEHPMQALGTAGDADRGLVLLVDQCEEVFSLCHDEVERKDYFSALDRWREKGLLVIAMRADRLSAASAYPVFARLLERSLHLLGAMSEPGLRDAVETPARQAGLLIEPGLVDVLVGEVAGTPGALPMLSHALLETWNRREANTLTVAAYTASGGIRGAVAQSAEKVYVNVPPDERHRLRDLVLRLVTVGAEGEPVRGRVPRRRLSSDAQSERLIDLLVASRLVTSDSGVVEIAHEALAGQWPRLRAWLDDDMEGQRILHHLTGAADAWNSMGRPDSELYRGPRLTRALHWKVGEDVTLTEVEVAFLDASERSDRIERRAEEARARAQARLIRRLRLALVGGTLMLVAALAAGGFAIRQKGTAEESADAALAAQTAADARRVAARALATDDLDLAMLLGVAGVQLDDSPETRSSLLAVLGGHPELIASTPMAGSRILWLDVSPDGRTVATYDTASHVRVYDIASGQLISELQAGKAAGLTWESGQARFSPDGRTLAVVVAAPTRHPVILLDADTLDSSGIELGGTSRWRWQFLDMAYSGDGSHLAATMWRVRGGDDRPRPTASWAFVWDLQQPGRPVARIRLGNGAPGVALSFDGRVLYTTMPSLTRHDLTSGRSAAVKDGEPVERLATSPDGRVMAGAAHGGLVLLDPVTGELQRRLSGNGDAGYYVSFSDDGSRVATVTFDRREAVVWEVSSGRVVARMPLGESGEVVDFSPDGATAYTAGSNHSLRHWDLDGQHRFLAQVAAVPAGRIGNIEAVQPAPGGGMLAYPASHRVTFLDVSSSSLGEALDRGRGYRSDHGGGSWHPNGMSYALPTGGEIRIWNAVTGDLVRRRQVSPPDLDTVDYGTDGRRLAIGELSGRVTMLDAATLAPTGRPVVLPDAVGRVSLGPDGTTAVALTGTVDASGFRTESITDWNLLDLDAGEVRDHGPLGISGYVIDISPDGRYAAVGGHDGDLLVLDLDTGQVVRPPVRGHSQGSLVLSLVYSADGSQILTTASDSTTVLWDGRTGLVDAQVVTPLRFAAATFATHGQDVLVAPEGDGGVFRWTPSTDYAMQFACTVAGRDLTEAEWRGIFPDRPYRPVCN